MSGKSKRKEELRDLKERIRDLRRKIDGAVNEFDQLICLTQAEPKLRNVCIALIIGQHEILDASIQLSSALIMIGEEE